ncbi:MAG: glycosyltransferase family 4 protein [Rhodospirillales bacterium]|nr:glycosyltransferase family 4 protein [Rhodospirillales bacterium]
MTATTGFPARVLMTTDAVGGVWQYTVELARGLCGSGSEVLVAGMGPEPSPAQRDAAAAIPGLSLQWHPGCLEWMNGAERDLDRASAWLAAQADCFSPDVVHLNSYAYAAAPWSVPLVVVCHSCVRTWWQAVRGGEAPPEWDGYGARVGHALRTADLVIAPTRAFLGAMSRTYGEPPQTMVIRNGRSGPFRPRTTRDPLIFSCGRTWDEAKGAGVLDAVAPRLPWPVYLAGDLRAPDTAGWTAPTGVLSLGRLDEAAIAAFLSRATIFALPALYEPFGLAVLEAAMSGCALVLGDIETLRELWGGAALFVDPRDEQAVEAALVRLIRDPELCRALAARAEKRAQSYLPEAMVAGYLRAYRRAAGPHPRGRDAADPDSAVPAGRPA